MGRGGFLLNPLAAAIPLGRDRGQGLSLDPGLDLGPGLGLGLLDGAVCIAALGTEM